MLILCLKFAQECPLSICRKICWEIETFSMHNLVWSISMSSFSRKSTIFKFILRKEDPVQGLVLDYKYAPTSPLSIGRKISGNFSGCNQETYATPGPLNRNSIMGSNTRFLAKFSAAKQVFRGLTVRVVFVSFCKFLGKAQQKLPYLSWLCTAYPELQALYTDAILQTTALTWQ